MRKTIAMILLAALGLSFNACGGGSSSSSTGSSTGTTITAVDGYIKNATLKDANGQVATYSATGGKYTFTSSVTYPLTLTGGVYEDTNASFDINMTCSSGTVISPITTFIDGNTTVLGKLANLALSGNPAALSDFSVDYVDTNNTDLAKLSQLLYAVAKDSNLTRKLRGDMNVTSLNALYTHIQSDINTSITDTTLQNNMRVFVQKVKDMNSSVALSSYETTLKNHKSVLSTATIIWKGKSYGQVISPFTGKIWLDRNLGASRVARAVDDNQSYGDYYQWGRAADGHQESNSTTTATLATDINAINANSKFITKYNTPYDWTTADTDGSLRSTVWSKTDGSSVCPVGYRVPTINELIAEKNNTTAFDSFLKFPSAVDRYYGDGSLTNQKQGMVWSSSPHLSKSISFSSVYGGTYYFMRANGFSVRCLKD